jgi:hypothetical protein
MRLNSVTPTFRGNHRIQVKDQQCASEFRDGINQELKQRKVEGEVSTTHLNKGKGDYVHVTTDLLPFGITSKRILLAGAAAVTDPTEAARITANVKQVFEDDAEKQGFIASFYTFKKD